MVVDDMFGDMHVHSFCEDDAIVSNQISQSKNAGTHVVTLKNMGTLPYDVEVETTLPQHPNLIEFLSGGAAWTLSERRMAVGDYRETRRSVSCISGLGPENIHVSRVSWKRADKPRWRRASGPYPLSLGIQVV